MIFFKEEKDRAEIDFNCLNRQSFHFAYSDCSSKKLQYLKRIINFEENLSYLSDVNLETILPSKGDLLTGLLKYAI